MAILRIIFCFLFCITFSRSVVYSGLISSTDHLTLTLNHPNLDSEPKMSLIIEAISALLVNKFEKHSSELRESMKSDITSEVSKHIKPALDTISDMSDRVLLLEKCVLDHEKTK